jgi:hypothetical protein
MMVINKDKAGAYEQRTLVSFFAGSVLGAPKTILRRARNEGLAK